MAREDITAEKAEIDDGPNNGEESTRRSSSLWRKVCDMEEAKNQLLFSLPMILTNLSYYAITLVSVMFASHLGQLQLAGATFANSWAFVTGFSLMMGLSGALETLCGQAFGFKQYRLRLLGICLQASAIISFFFSGIISVIWLYTESTLVLLHQHHDVSKQAALYLRYLIPGLYAYGFLQNTLRFLQTQSDVWPLVFISVLSAGLHFGVSYALVHCTSLGYKGAALAASIQFWISFLLLAVYVLLAKRFQHTWKGFSLESFSFVWTTLKLALPSAAMLGVLGFSDSCVLSWIVAASMAVDPMQGVLLGVTRGCGWQKFTVWLNLAAFYCIGMPTELFLGFKFKLLRFVQRLWIGLICGLSSQAAALLLITLCRNWSKKEIIADRENESRSSLAKF